MTSIAIITGFIMVGMTAAAIAAVNYYDRLMMKY